MKTIIYHHNDEDGWASAAIILKKFPNAELVACFHGNEFEFVKNYDHVFVVDFVFSQKDMDFLKNNNKEFTWIDHHISAIETITGDFTGIRQEGIAACKLCWEYFFPKETIPQVIDFIAGFDIWDFSKKGTKEFMFFLETQLGVNSKENVKKILSMMHFSDNEYEEALRTGEYINQYHEKITAKQEIRGIKKVFQGYNAKLFFSNTNTSELGNFTLNKNPDIDIVVIIDFVMVNNIPMYKYSMRSRKENGVDVSSIAKRFGGGGHPAAAGFQSLKRLWEE